MEAPPLENSQPTTNSSDEVAPQDQTIEVPQASDANGSREPELKLSAEEVKKELEIIASTGKFWHDWDELKSMLAFQLKQVLSEYPEATKDDTKQNSSLGESFVELEKRLEEALFCFIEGPPFTLQRLCEILLEARTIYPNLSKLALALEKNLLVTSTLTRSTDPHPSSTTEASIVPEEKVEDDVQPPQPESPPQPPHPTTSVENGGEPMTADRDADTDEVMSEVEAQVDDDKVDDKVDDGSSVTTMDMDTVEETVRPSESNPEEPTENS